MHKVLLRAPARRSRVPTDERTAAPLHPSVAQSHPAAFARGLTCLFRVVVCGATLVVARGWAQDLVTITIAGQAGQLGLVNGPGPSARFNFPSGIVADAAGNLYVTDNGNNVVRKISPSAQVSTFAGAVGTYGHADGTGAAARFNSVQAIAIDSHGNLFVGDNDSMIRRITPAGVVTTLAGSPTERGSADGTGSQARFRAPRGIAVDSAGNIYVADTANRIIRKITPGGVVSTLAGTFNDNYSVTGTGDGVGPAARFGSPTGIVVDGSGTLYVSDTGYRSIRRITPQGVVTTIAGTYNGAGVRDGTGSQALFSYPSAMTMHPSGDIYLLEPDMQVIRRVTPAGVVTTVVGVAGLSGAIDGLDRDARFNWPGGITSNAIGDLFIADTRNYTIRQRLLASRPSQLVAPLSTTVALGGTAQFTVQGSGTPAPAYQWIKDGVDIPGATQSTLTINNVRFEDAARYTVSATNLLGGFITAPVRLFVIALPVLATQPLTQSVAEGAPLTLNVTVSGGTPVTYRWQKDGADLPGATTSSLNLPTVLPSDTGRYSVAVSNASGSVTSAAAVVTVLSSRFVNLSVRTSAGNAESALIVGFVASGSRKPLLVRGNGASLAQLGVSGAMSDPQLVLYRSGVPLAVNDDWHLSPDAIQVAAVASRVGAFAVSNPSRDSAILQTVVAGVHSAHVFSANGQPGICLAEVYDTDSTGEGRLVNLSARSHVGQGDNTLIAGFVIAGNTKKRVLIRGAGPALSAFGVGGILGDPRLAVFQNGITLIGANDNWSENAAAVSAAAAQVGAFPFAADAKDAALILLLDPGAYTAQVSGVGNTTGVALVEVYEVP